MIEFLEKYFSPFSVFEYLDRRNIESKPLKFILTLVLGGLWIIGFSPLWVPCTVFVLLKGIYDWS